MSLINPTLLYGLAFASIPIVLHFLLRAKPKTHLFPALRLIEVRRRQNVRRMRLRHLWLLLLRVAVIVFLVLAVARPSLPAADYNLSARELLSLLAILCVVCGVYWGILFYWRRQSLPEHTTAYRRAFLRGGAGVVCFVLLALFVAWPYQRRIAAEMAAPLPQVAERFPAAGVFLFDSSLSMQYRFENKTRLEMARQIAIEHLNHLPNHSRIAVTDTSTDNPMLFQADLGSAESRIEKLKTHARAYSLNDRLRTALKLQEEDRQRTLDSQTSVAENERRDGYLREIYVLTDLARSGWIRDPSGLLRTELERLPWVNVYLIDVGIPAPQNVGLTSLKLSTESVPRGGHLLVQATVAPTGLDDQERVVELFLNNSAGNRVKQGQQTVSLDSSSKTRVQFTLRGLNGPLHRGELKLRSSDPFPGDDTLYFTVQVHPPVGVLLVGPSRTQTDYLHMALAPTELVRSGQAEYRCTYIPPHDLPTIDFADYQIVCLISVPELSEETWRELDRYVEAGGGLAVFLGTSSIATAVSYNRRAAQAVLPAELVACLKFHPPEFLDLRNLNHPILQKFAEFGGAAELAAEEVLRYWKVQPAKAAHVIVPYTDPDRTAALLERVHGRGRVVLLTTTIDLKGWSQLPRARWQFLAFAHQLMRYLTQGAQTRSNYLVGEEVFIPLETGFQLRRYSLRKPSLQQVSNDVPANASRITIPDADQVGHYEVVSADPNVEFSVGFSVNLSPDESDFTRLTTADLDALFGKKRYSVARDIQGLTRRVAAGRLGEEVFPLVLAIAIVIFCVEHFVANWFYQESP